MYRQQKLGEEERSITETDQKNISEKMEVEEMKTASKSVVEAATSSSNTPKEQTEQVETCPSKSPRPDVVSSTLNSSSSVNSSPSPKDRQMSKSMAMLSQIFPGKSQKVLEIKLREARGDVVKALEACAKHFDNVEQHQQNSHHGEFIHLDYSLLIQSFTWKITKYLGPITNTVFYILGGFKATSVRGAFGL
jgi:hypothetical protein